MYKRIFWAALALVLLLASCAQPLARPAPDPVPPTADLLPRFEAELEELRPRSVHHLRGAAPTAGSSPALFSSHVLSFNRLTELCPFCSSRTIDIQGYTRSVLPQLSLS